MDKRKLYYYGIAMGIPLLNYARKALVAKLTPDPRMCPKCSYKMVSEVRRLRVREKKTGEKATLGYWRCSACRAQYKRMDEGPFQTPTDQEWNAFVGGMRPRR